MKRYLLPALLLTAVLPYLSFSQEQAFRNEQSAIVESERKAAEARLSAGMQSVASGNYDVNHYRCEWQLDPAVRYVRGKITTSFTMIQAGNTITFDMVNQLLVDSVVYHGTPIVFSRLPNNGLVVPFPANINAGARDSVSVYYQGDPAGGGFGAFYQGLHSGVPVIWTLSEPYGAKDWWPCKDDLTDKADSIDILMTHPATYTSSSNGMMTSRQAVAGGNVVTHFKHRYRIATYLVAIAITNYVVNNDTVQVGNKVYPFISYAYPESLGFFFAQETFAKNAFRIFTQLFGEYPFANEKYGHTQFGWGGGMEHQTNSFMFNTSPNLSAHELAHQWFGDKVTCGSWQHIWLNEGFATYLTALFLQYGYPTFYRPYLQNTMLASIVSQPGGSVIVPDTTNTNRIFDGRLSYNKGGYVVHMLRWVLGDSVFFHGMRQYLEDPLLKYNFAKTADLQRNLEQVSGKNLSTFFQKWVYGEGYANYHATWYQAAGSPWVTLKLDQTTSHNSVQFYEMPVEIEFRKGTQSVRRVVDHRNSGQIFSLNVGFAVDTVIIDPDLWILANTKTAAKTSVDLLPPDDLQLYPNPSPGDATLRLRNASGNKLSVRLFNAAGQLIFRRDIATAAGAQVEVNIPFARYPKGVYVIDIQNDRSLKVRRKIVH